MCAVTRKSVKRAFRYRFHPTGAQAAEARGSANRDKARREAARVHARITGRRRDFLHKPSTRLVRENQAVVIEDSTVRNLVKNRRWSTRFTTRSN